MNLYILKYNNYYNRTIKKEDSLTDYLQYQLGNVIQGVSFNPGDGVATQQVVNLSEDQIGDYLLAVNENNEIDSRWFILDCRRERTGQYTLTLRRDLVADNYSTIINAPCFIEKATLDDSDPMIYNSEDMTFNQIKTSETQLKDETGCAWVVGYIPKDSFSEATEITADYPVEGGEDITVNGIDNWEFAQYQTQQFKAYPSTFNYAGYARSIVFGPAQFVIGWGTNNKGQLLDTAGNSLTIEYTTAPSWSDTSLRNDTNIAVLSRLRKAYPSKWASNVSQLNSLVGAYLDTETTARTTEFRNLQGKIIKDTATSIYYKVKIVDNGETTKSINISSGSLFNKLDELLVRSVPDPTEAVKTLFGTANANTYKVGYITNTYTIRLEKLTNNAKVTISSDRYHLEDQPYDMFCIPYSDDLVVKQNGTAVLTSNKSAALNIATAIGAQTGTGNIYDIQLLPYCPSRNIITADGEVDIANVKTNFVTDNSGQKITVVIWALSSQFTFNIPYEISVGNKKIESRTDMYRLSSPNFNGQFEFNAAMNDGVDYFSVDCSYKPFNPYIHINPNFKNLYGQDFNDARGLICGGDFSLPQLSSAWANYQLNNKNFNEIFNRDILNLEINNAVQREQQKWQIASGAVGAGISGALTGAIAGGPIGALVGGIIGGGVSTAAGIRDYQLSEQLRQEAIDYKIDQFGYQLGNIQAIPYSISKTSAFTYNNKIFPILEYYTCTPQEKAALQDKLYYNGMTVMRIGTIQEFLRSEPSYIKGKLIRLEDTDNNFHVVNEIANEINKGVFI